jgi:hypothetical protein
VEKTIVFVLPHAQGRNAWLGFQDFTRRFGFAARAKGASSLSRFAESDPSRGGQDWRQFPFVWVALETHLFSSRAESRAHCFGLRRFAGGDFAGAVTTSNCC